MEAPIGLRIGNQPLTLLVSLIALGKVIVGVADKVVPVHKVVSLLPVVRRVKINQLDPAQICLLQQLECIEVIALDEEVLRGVEVHALFPAWAQRFGDGRVGGEQRLALAGPGQVVALQRAFNDGIRQFLPQLVKVYRQLHAAVLASAFRHAPGKQLAKACDVLLREIGRMHF